MKSIEKKEKNANNNEQCYFYEQKATENNFFHWFDVFKLKKPNLSNPKILRRLFRNRIFRNELKAAQ